ncbi:MAG: hypothetical protein JRE40_01175 [Deltaproteobacteria bacterium]|nr:hypothetical protein [Deltaproteobacteria bacterium]
MKVKCPHCGHIDNAPDEFVGKQVNCPKCKKSLIAGDNIASIGEIVDASVVIANKTKTEEAAKKGKPPPEPAGPILLPIVGGLAAMFGLLGMAVMVLAMEPVGIVAGVVGFLGGLTVMAVAEIQGHVERTAHWAKRIHEELCKQNGGQKK